jgi:hypothetical protein
VTASKQTGRSEAALSGSFFGSFIRFISHAISSATVQMMGSRGTQTSRSGVASSASLMGGVSKLTSHAIAAVESAFSGALVAIKGGSLYILSLGASLAAFAATTLRGTDRSNSSSTLAAGGNVTRSGSRSSASAAGLFGAQRAGATDRTALGATAGQAGSTAKSTVHATSGSHPLFGGASARLTGLAASATTISFNGIAAIARSGAYVLSFTASLLIGSVTIARATSRSTPGQLPSQPASVYRMVSRTLSAIADTLQGLANWIYAQFTGTGTGPIRMLVPVDCSIRCLAIVDGSRSFVSVDGSARILNAL